MIQPSFHIIHEQLEVHHEGPVNLLVVYHPSQMLFLWYRQNIAHFEKFAIYDLPLGKESEPLVHIRQILDQELADRQAIVSLLYNLPAATLLPAAYYDMDIAQALLSVVAGDAARQLILSEKVTGEDIYNSYRVPAAVHQLFQEKLKSGVFWHFNSKWIGEVKKAEQPDLDTLHLVFYPDFFNLGYVKQGVPQLFQAYTYQTPEDVSFQLLTIARELSLDPQELYLSIAGMVAEDSALMEELQKYFLHLSFLTHDHSLWSTPALDEWPSQYFSNLLQLSLCV